MLERLSDKLTQIARQLSGKAAISEKNVQEAVEAWEADADYVEFQRYRTCKVDTDAGVICQSGLNGDAGAVANGQAHGSPGPGAIGHSKG